jgi:hypothetical protein
MAALNLTGVSSAVSTKPAGSRLQLLHEPEEHDSDYVCKVVTGRSRPGHAGLSPLPDYSRNSCKRRGIYKEAEIM